MEAFSLRCSTCSFADSSFTRWFRCSDDEDEQRTAQLEQQLRDIDRILAATADIQDVLGLPPDKLKNDTEQGTIQLEQQLQDNDEHRTIQLEQQLRDNTERCTAQLEQQLQDMDRILAAIGDIQEVVGPPSDNLKNEGTAK